MTRLRRNAWDHEPEPRHLSADACDTTTRRDKEWVGVQMVLHEADPYVYNAAGELPSDSSGLLDVR